MERWRKELWRAIKLGVKRSLERKRMGSKSQSLLKRKARTFRILWLFKILCQTSKTVMNSMTLKSELMRRPETIQTLFSIWPISLVLFRPMQWTFYCLCRKLSGIFNKTGPKFHLKLSNWWWIWSPTSIIRMKVIMSPSGNDLNELYSISKYFC